jgi:predicted dehydrogenase
MRRRKRTVERVIRWGMWGTGVLAHSVASDFPLAKGAALHAVSSRDPLRAQRFASLHGIPNHYAGLQALLDDAEIDAIFVASPNHRHTEDSLACIQAGKSVLCEKPFALNAAQAQRVANAARSHNLFCMEAMWMRFVPALVEVKRSIDAGEIGAVRMIQGNFAYPVAEGIESRFFNLRYGGGALLDRGVYLISLVQQLLGAPRSVRGTASIGATGVDEQSAYQLQYDGALADLTASLRVRGSNEVAIFGERGSLRLCEPFYRADRVIFKPRPEVKMATQQSSLESPRAGRSLADTLLNAPAAKSLRRRAVALLATLERGRSFPFSGNGYQFELMEVGRCLRAGRTESTIMPLADSLQVMQTMDALRAQWGMVFPIEQSGEAEPAQ